jgi:hypothetical protein
MINILNHFLPEEILSQIFSKYLTVNDVSRFDAAITERKKRTLFLECIGSPASIWLGDEEVRVRVRFRDITDNENDDK